MDEGLGHRDDLQRNDESDETYSCFLHLTWYVHSLCERLLLLLEKEEESECAMPKPKVTVSATYGHHVRTRWSGSALEQAKRPLGVPSQWQQVNAFQARVLANAAARFRRRAAEASTATCGLRWAMEDSVPTSPPAITAPRAAQAQHQQAALNTMGQNEKGDRKAYRST
ncbi:UNVERIFIED_CONTAM: hypothetical protein K2H54_063078 [Gekko kuhli]